jgi:hypothetical protein
MITIFFIIFCFLTLAPTIIIWLNCKNKEDLKIFKISIVAFLILIIHCVLFFKTEGTSETKIIILISAIIIIIVLPIVALCIYADIINLSKISKIAKTVVTVILTLIWFSVVISIIIYSIILAVKSGIKFEYQTEFNVYLVVNNVIGGLIIFLHNTVIGPIIFYLVCSIDCYILYYLILKVINPISLLLFWVDLWYISFAIYTTIESYIAGEKVVLF